MLSRVLAIKWRPHSFSSLVGQEHITKTLTNALSSQRLHHAYLFCGTRGVGKTTVARILAKCLSCEKGIISEACNECSTCKSIDAGNYADLIEVDAASRTKVESTRELLDDMQFAPTKGRYKIYLIDEVHMLSNHSFNALLKSLEEPPAHIIFLFATTEPQKLPITVISRCLKFTLKALEQKAISARLREILPQENVDFDEESLKFIAYYAAGSMRDALSLTDQAIAYCDSKLQGKLVAEMLGVTGIVEATELLGYVASGDLSKITSVMGDMEKAGANFVELWDRMMIAIHGLTLITLGFTDDQSDELIALATKFSKEELQLFYQISLNTKRELAWVPSMRGASEMGFVRMLTMQPLADALNNNKQGTSIPSRHLQSAQESNISATPAVAKEVAATPAVEEVADEQVAEEPVAEESVAEEPVAEEPVAAEPVAAEPVAEEPVAAEPVAEEPVAEESVAEEPVAEESVAEEPVAAEPVAAEPVAAEPVAEEPVAEEPVADEPVAEEPVAEEVTATPVVEEVAAEPQHPASSKNNYTQPEEWAELVNELDLSGMSASIIRDTRLAEVHGGIWVIHCISNVRSMFTEEIISAVETAIFEKINQSIQIEVEVGPVEDTPAMLVTLQRREMVEKIKQEPIVSTMINKLGGEIVEDSVQQINEAK
ncbi:MAG: DNA polymerase III subunit gamma/tau [Gammaproteobacteria bacterium]|nr:DNA polymerase III subunit gamma/tau [Gammaproteobacteria bacterium]